MNQRHQKGKSSQFTRKKIESYSYGLLDEIGKGYSSKVYKGRHDDTQENVAVKVIDLKQLKNDINKELLSSQIQILNQLKGTTNILKLYDIFTTKNNTYIITELCVSDLSKTIKAGISELEALQYMKSVVIGYLQLYKRNIVHRDLKPANILITQNNQIKIADFGFAIKLQCLAKNSKYNVGSPLYMAPQSLKRNEYSFKSDIWSLGIIFYEMLFNGTPWKAKTEKELLKKIESEPIQNIINTHSLTDKSKQFLIKCLNIERADRISPLELSAFIQSFNSKPLTQKSNNLMQKPIVKQSIIMGQLHQDRPLYQNDKQVKRYSPKRQKCSSQNRQNQHYHYENKPISDNLSHENKKLISKILISQVHFSRFLFKLLQRIKQSQRYGVLKKNHHQQIIQAININYSAIIKFKIQNLINFNNHNFIRCQGYRQYKKTSDYEKLTTISNEYFDRYKSQLQKYWNEEYSLDAQPTNCLIRTLYQLLDNEVKNMQNPQQQINRFSADIIVLDYLVTAKQLLDMIRTHPQAYQKFARKSRIQQIVQGKTVQIHYQLYHQIMTRAKQVMQKPKFMSFGGQLMNEKFITNKNY